MRCPMLAPLVAALSLGRVVLGAGLRLTGMRFGLVLTAVGVGLVVGGLGPGVMGLGPAVMDAEAQGKVRVVASLPDLKALTEAVGGDLVEVDSLGRGTQNPHDIEVRPSLMLKLRRADLFVRNGAGGDPWADPILQGGQNARIFPGAPGYVDASGGVSILPPSGPVDRSRGDVHPEGNPHYTLDPANASIVTANIVTGLKRVAPQYDARFDARRREFLAQLDTAVDRWQRTLEPVRGARVVTYHETFNYLLRRFGLELAGAIEDRPGIPPSPAHLANLIRVVKEQNVKAIVAEPYADQRVVQLVGRDSGVKVLVLPPAVGGVKGADTYLAFIDHNVTALAEALK
jgi:zinc/manganese transport system substrate-binding protein